MKTTPSPLFDRADGPVTAPIRVAAIILAAGRGLRFDAGARTTKAVALLHGVPLVRRVAMTALRSQATRVIVVCGYDHASVEAALGGLNVEIIYNAAFADGMASSLSAGLAALPKDVDGMLVILADMPLIRSETLDTLIACFATRRGACDAIVPTYRDVRGNPVLIGRRLFPALRLLRGDKGARHLLSAPDLAIDQCDVDDPGIAIDVDTPAALARCETT